MICAACFRDPSGVCETCVGQCVALVQRIAEANRAARGPADAVSRRAYDALLLEVKRMQTQLIGAQATADFAANQLGQDYEATQTFLRISRICSIGLNGPDKERT